MAGGQVVSCPHMVLRNLQIDINLDIINDSRKCSICHEKVQKGGDLWLCLFRDCYTKVCCGEDDHRETHTSHYKKHTLFVAVRSMRVWCTVCKAFINVQGNQGTVREEDADDSDDDEEEIVDDGECRMDEAHLKANGLTGLSNQGNTCYMNAALQALSNTPPLTQFFLECGETAIEAVSRDSAGQKRLNTLSKAYHWLMQEMWDRKKRGFVAPNGVLYGIRTVNPTFRGNMQQDTQEFLRSFMDNLHEELKVKVVEPPPAPMCECSLPEQDDEEMSDADNAEASVPNVTVAAYGEPHNDVRPPTNESEAGGASSQSEGEEYETCDSGVSERSSLSEEATSLDAENNRPLSNPPSPLPAKSRIASASAEPPRTPSATSIRRKAQTQFRSIISDVFDGKILSSVECLTCNRISTRVEAFQDLSLPIPNRDHLNILHQGSVNINTTLAKCSEQLYSVENNGPPRKRGRRTLTRGRLSKSATRQVPVDEPSEPQHQESKKSTQNESVPQVGSTEPEHQESQKEVDPPPGSLIAQSKELLNYPIVHPVSKRKHQNSLPFSASTKFVGVWNLVSWNDAEEVSGIIVS